MSIEKHLIITVEDENNVDMVESFLGNLYKNATNTNDDGLHLKFLTSIFNLLSVQPLTSLINTKTELTIKHNGQFRTKRYEVIKSLGLNPIYELRYAFSGNEHLRLLFFPFEYKEKSLYIFVKCFIKTLTPPVDNTDLMRDLTHNIYMRIKVNPNKYLEGVDLNE